ncbi:hypothetical protein K504DRAFT_493765 [Pleomassaria siparia CBS 279.74]|uniref:Mid2 domain-containing protein n=1 Tax=Pleomassaria siparia CBS 279.74 TaxID=1314801 RepID=A0A6G1JZ87_9PLEO|nr:hypothetical protein K504DRAFT_493765 [Pleomassaria siparia CBS 279.74]
MASANLAFALLLPQIHLAMAVSTYEDGGGAPPLTLSSAASTFPTSVHTPRIDVPGGDLVTKKPLVAPLRPVLPSGVGDAAACDQGRGAFLCPRGTCFYDDSGALACCNGTTSCVAVTTCIPYGENPCPRGEFGCMSCESAKPSCYTSTNPAMNIRALYCNTVGGGRTTSFTFDMAKMTEKAPVSTMDGAPVAVSSALATPASTPALSAATSTAVSLTSDMANINSTPTSNVTVPISGDEHSGIAGSTLAVITVGSVGGAAILTLALWLLYKCHRNRKPKHKSGVLPGPRVTAPGESPISVTRKGSPGAANQLTGSTVNELDGEYRGNGRFSGPSYTHVSPDFISVLPPPSPVSIAAPSRSSQHPHRASIGGLTPKSKYTPSSSTIPFASPLASTSSEVPGSHSPTQPTSPSITITEPDSSQTSYLPASAPYIPTLTPITPFCPTFQSSPTTPATPAFSRSTSTAALIPILPAAEENERKSSRLLPIAGPYLSAEQAMGEGYWEAEREQREADRVMEEQMIRMRVDGTRKMSGDEGVDQVEGFRFGFESENEDQERTVVGSEVDGDPYEKGEGSDVSTGTVIRRRI